MDAATSAWLDQKNAHMTDLIRQHGWFIQGVGGGMCSRLGCAGDDQGDEPPFAYTVGLFGLGHPELLIFDLPLTEAAHVLNALGSGVRSGQVVMPGLVTEVDGWPHRVIPEEVPNPGTIVFSANDFYQRPDEASVPVIQISYDDANGRFPSDPGYVGPYRQPRPGTFTA